jgi:hypothetical protein
MVTQRFTTRLVKLASVAAVIGMAACSGGGSLPATGLSAQSAALSASKHESVAAGATASPIGARAIPIGARAIPIGARAIPIGARAIPINLTTLPQLLSVCGGLLGAECGAIRRLDVIPALNLVTNLIAGYQPDDLQMAYNVPAGGGSGQTIGIVVAMSDPNAESDLAVYRSEFGLPACSTASGCLRFAAQNGSVSLPAPDENWAQELSIDLDMASAICPNCKLLVVEANSSDIDNLTAAASTAVALGATVVSNSYTTPETAATAAENAKWNHPGVPMVAGAGDSGYGVGWPASSSYVTAVGGTTLLPVVDDLFFLETAWGNTGSGCSKYIAKPAWQHDLLCRYRTVNDVAAIANPVPGVSVYDTYFAQASNAGWNVYGGTSVATPIVAGMYALAGNGRSVSDARGIYANTGSLNDIILGANSLCLTYLCTSGLGYSGPTGFGTPNGIGAF